MGKTTRFTFSLHIRNDAEIINYLLDIPRRYRGKTIRDAIENHMQAESSEKTSPANLEELLRKNNRLLNKIHQKIEDIKTEGIQAVDTTERIPPREVDSEKLKEATENLKNLIS